MDETKKETKEDLEDKEYLDEMYKGKYDPTGGLKDITPEDTLDAKELEEKTDYNSLVEDDEEIKAILEYRRLLQKEKDKIGLTPEEKTWKLQIEELHLKETQAKDEQEAQAKEEAEKQKLKEEEIRREYEQTKQETPEKIIQARESEVVLTGSESIPKILSLVFKLRKARKQGGKVLVQVFRNRKVVLKWTRNDINFVEFWTKDEKGNALVEVTRFSEYKYTFEGTPIPVLFAVQGYAEGFDFFSQFRKDLTSEIVSRLVMRSYIAGYTKGAEIKQKETKKGMLDSLQPLMPVIIIGGFLLIGYLMYTMYGEIQDMIVIMDALKTQLNITTQVIGP